MLVDETARAISGSLTTAMVALSILVKVGATILHNLICSKTVPEVITEDGGTAVRTRVGHSFIKQVMAETGAVFGGETRSLLLRRQLPRRQRSDRRTCDPRGTQQHDGGLADLVSSLDRRAS